jgi:hypothetical protein
MQTDGDRTKCLDVPMKLVSSDGSTGLYAGLFFPFRAARYDGKLSVGDDVSDVTFDVNKIAVGAAPAGDLPAAEPIDTAAAPLTFVSSAQLPLVAGAAIAFWTVVGLVFLGRQRRAAPGRSDVRSPPLPSRSRRSRAAPTPAGSGLPRRMVLHRRPPRPADQPQHDGSPPLRPCSSPIPRRSAPSRC